MKIQYISCHSILEYDEVKLLTDLGFEVYSNGAYRDPAGAYTLPRPGIEGALFDEEFFRLTSEYPKTDLPKELIDPFDVFIIMAGQGEQALTSNWEKIKHKRVIWRSIGQNTPQTEKMLQKYVAEGLEIVRYSPNEQKYENYAGERALIRFYKDPDVFKGWRGNTKKVINITQSLKARGKFVHYDEIMGALIGFEGKIYGTGNDDLGKMNGGEISFKKMLEVMKEARAYVYAGTWPACYTLTLIEAMMLGIPVVAFGKEIAQSSGLEKFDFYEVEDIIQSGYNGYICNSIQEARQRVADLVEDKNLAEMVSKAGRERAIELFGKDKIGAQWKALLNGEGVAQDVDKN